MFALRHGGAGLNLIFEHGGALKAGLKAPPRGEADDEGLALARQAEQDADEDGRVFHYHVTKRRRYSFAARRECNHRDHWPLSRSIIT